MYEAPGVAFCVYFAALLMGSLALGHLVQGIRLDWVVNTGGAPRLRVVSETYNDTFFLSFIVCMGISAAHRGPRRDGDFHFTP